MNVLSIIEIVFSSFIVITAVFVVLDLFSVILSFQKLFIKIIETGNNNSETELGLSVFLLAGLRKTVKASSAYLYTFENDELKENYVSVSEKGKNLYTGSPEHRRMKFTKKQIEIMKKGKIDPILAVKLFSKEIEKKGIIHRKAIAFPLFKNDRIEALFVFIYDSRSRLLNGRRLIYFNNKKFAKIIMSLIIFIKSRSSNTLNLVMENIRDYSFITLDTNLNITSWNKGSVIMFGYDFHEVVDMSFRDLFSPDYRKEFDKAVKISAVKEETHFRAEMHDLNHTPIMCEVLLKPIHVKELPVGYYILIKDVSKEEVLKTNMRNKSLMNHSIVENARDGITILNEDDRIIFTNEKFKRITDTNVAFLGVDIASVFGKKNGDKIKNKLNEMKSAGLEFNSMDIKIGDFWFNIRYFPIKDEKGVYNGAALFFIDNTLRMKYREEIEEKNKLLESMNKRLLADIRAGQLLQMSLIPQVLPNDRSVTFESIYILSEQLGGDFYYAEEYRLGKNKYYIAMMSDVSGHGIASSMMTVFVKEIYNEFKNTTETEKDFKASRFLNMLNRRLFELNMENQIFITAYCYIIDISRGMVYFSSAGHPHMALIRRNGNIRFCGIEKSPPLGIVEKYLYSDDIEEIEKGDKLILYTDGLLDIFASSDSYYAYFNNFLMENRQLDVDDFKMKIEKRIFDLIKENKESRDDLTVLLTKIK